MGLLDALQGLIHPALQQRAQSQLAQLQGLRLRQEDQAKEHEAGLLDQLRQSTIAENKAQAERAARAQRDQPPMIGSPEWQAAETFKATLDLKNKKDFAQFEAGLPGRATAGSKSGAVAQGGQAKAGPPSEFERKAAMLYPRAAHAAENIDRLLAQDEDPSLKSKLNRVPVLGNFLLTGREQAINQAAEELSAAILRLESGAAISAEEIKRYSRQFVPEPGDGPAVLEQKRQSRMIAVEQLRVAADRAQQAAAASATARPAATASPAATQAAPPANASTGDLVSKYGLTPKGK